MSKRAEVKFDDLLFVRRNAEKEAARMRDFHNPEYAKEMYALIYGAAPAPVRSRVRDGK